MTGKQRRNIKIQRLFLCIFGPFFFFAKSSEAGKGEKGTEGKNPFFPLIDISVRVFFFQNVHLPLSITPLKRGEEEEEEEEEEKEEEAVSRPYQQRSPLISGRPNQEVMRLLLHTPQTVAPKCMPSRWLLPS